MLIGATKGADINLPAILTQLLLFSMLFIVTFSSYLRLTNDLHPAQDTKE
jgi:hypothetical protein